MIKVYEVLRVLLFPLVRFFLPMISHKGKKRVNFELNNLVEVNKLKKAQYGFEVSSEGELEQVIFIIRHLLKHEKTVEIIYCSESVEHKIKILSKEYPEKIRYLRMPLLTYKPWVERQNAYDWLTCETFILCRYDFFPELFFYGKIKAKNFFLISATVKNYDQKNFVAKFYLNWCYSLFDKILFTTDKDKQYFEKLKITEQTDLMVADLRSLQIQERLSNREKRIGDVFPVFKFFEETIIKKSKRNMIFGSFWENECKMFRMLKPDDLFNTCFCIVPHKLSKKDILSIIEHLNHYQLAVYIIDKNTDEKRLHQLKNEFMENPGLWLFDIKGVLCELYASFSHAYIGGGFGESVHSVLEPYLSGCQVICGPKTHRSTEVDTIISQRPERLTIVKKLDETLTEKYFQTGVNITPPSSIVNLDTVLDFLGLNSEN